MRIKVVGYLEPDEDEIDDEDESGLTAEAYDRYAEMFEVLTNLTFVKVP